MSRAKAAIPFCGVCVLAACAAAPTASPDAAATVSLPQASAEPEPAVTASASAQPTALTPPPPSVPPSFRFIDHKPCDTRSPGARGVDLNNDGKPDVFKVFSGSMLVCRASDLTFDGVFDVYVYFAPDGSTDRVERDLDGDGQIDTVVFRSDAGNSCVELIDRDGDHRADSAERILDCAAKLQ